MLDLKNDIKCQEIERKLDYYADKTRNWQIERNRYVKKGGGNKFKYADISPYPYNDDKEREIINQIDEYMLSFDNQDKIKVNGHFLWKYKNYLSQPFAKHAIALVEHAIMAYPLSDNDKIKFLEYLFKYQKETENKILYKFNKRVLYKLVNYNPNDNLEATNRLYNKALSFFDSPKRKNNEQMQLLFGMFEIFTQNVKKISPEAVVNYSKIYFAMADRTDKELEALVLQRLLVKTPDSEKWAQVCCDKEVLDKATAKDVVEAYGEHVYKQNSFNEQLNIQMKSLIKYLFDNNEYTLKEADLLIDCLRPEKMDVNGKKIRNSNKRALLQKMADELSVYVHLSNTRRRNPLKNFEIDNSEEVISKEKIVEYADFLFDEARKNQNIDISTKNIYGLFLRKGKLDKNLVLEVMDVYGQSLTQRDLEQEKYNISLHDKMTKMLGKIVVEYDYSPDEVALLRRHIERGAGGSAEFVEMGRVIETNYRQQDDWHCRHFNEKYVAPISHVNLYNKY